MTEPTLPLILAGVLAVSLNAYVVTAGADFGGGVWDLFASGPRRDRQRELIAHAIGPIWEANHVWLILAIVLTFTCFPPVFARVSIVLHIPLTLMLIGIVLRGSAFTFRTYDEAHDVAQRRWGRIFAIASIVTPVLLGVVIGTVAAGRVGDTGGPGFVARFVEPWFTPFSLAIGLLTLVLFAFLAAVFLTLETDDPALVGDFRRRALAAGGAVFLAAFVALLLAPGQAPLVGRGLLGSRWALPFHVVTGLASVLALAALWLRRYRLSRVAAVAQVSLIFWGWVLSQHPYLLAPDLTIGAAAAPAVTLRLVLGALMLGTLVLLPSLWYLFRVFKAGPVEQADRQSPGGSTS